MCWCPQFTVPFIQHSSVPASWLCSVSPSLPSHISSQPSAAAARRVLPAPLPSAAAYRGASGAPLPVPRTSFRAQKQVAFLSLRPLPLDSVPCPCGPLLALGTHISTLALHSHRPWSPGALGLDSTSRFGQVAVLLIVRHDEQGSPALWLVPPALRRPPCLLGQCRVQHISWHPSVWGPP